MINENQKIYHAQEAVRIKNELDNLGPEFAPDGIVRTVLQNRIEQEKSKAEKATNEEPNVKKILFDMQYRKDEVKETHDTP